MKNRRDTLKHSAVVASLLAGTGLFPAAAFAEFNKTAFEAKSLNDVLKAIGVTGAPAESKDVTITAPDIAENGAVVPLGASSALPGVKQILILVEKNPAALVALFNITDSVEANVSTRSKMGQSSDVYAGWTKPVSSVARLWIMAGLPSHIQSRLKRVSALVSTGVSRRA